MTKSEFSRLLVDNVERAVRLWNVDRKTPGEWSFELSGLGADPRVLLGLSDVIDKLYIAENTFFRIIDIGIKRLAPGGYSVFVRPSGHAPGAWSDTWNTPKGNGPFKVLGPPEGDP
jgi:hypothetical protein